MRHSSPEFAALAENGTILRCLVGSTVHGTAVDDQGDRDEMGICVEPKEYVVGLRRFDQYIHRTRPDGVRSGPGDLDLTVYSLRKWMRLALDGNPTVLLPLFVPDSQVVRRTPLADELRAQAHRFATRAAGRRFIGYLRSQRESMLGLRGGRKANRPELIERFGFDVKFAHHMVRLGIRGVELMETGRITLPMAEPWRSWLVALRTGGHTREEALDEARALEDRLLALVAAVDLPDAADREWADRWLVDAYERVWSGGEPGAGVTPRPAARGPAR
ncbi:putative nucleotidyltransferase [Murinocardiopsis flavida]|uniref:Putative nucleotidyltransferase n=1 Tax=Murinocardiopsis flavida TaxID=645275 RepID=A0A2P8DI54_9ACTN|nr:nucleotidyltransferase domain-containing protein [Murinocardiopsis flavida]PSK96849.1 putative nucleotidyltransferase [Murinocardiopsis flavida]